MKKETEYKFIYVHNPGFDAEPNKNLQPRALVRTEYPNSGWKPLRENLATFYSFQAENLKSFKKDQGISNTLKSRIGSHSLNELIDTINNLEG